MSWILQRLTRRARRTLGCAVALASVAVAVAVAGAAAATGANDVGTSPGPPLPGQAISVQINQVALERRGPKAAVIEYSDAQARAQPGAQAGGRFTVLQGGVPVRTGALRALPEFVDWGAGKRYFEADFSTLEAAGTYQVQVEIGEQRGESAPFIVADHAVFTETAAKLLDYFKASRYLDEADRHIRIFGSERYADVWGGWKDAGGDTGKYLSHLSFANFFNPQQTPMVTWVLARTYDDATDLYKGAGLDRQVLEEAFWGADFLHRLLDPDGYFYETVFDRWGTPGAERVVTGFEGLDGVYSTNYRAAFREGGGMAIAALARASIIAAKTGRHGEFGGSEYLADAQRAFAHLQQYSARYCDDGVENIIDDYAALMAATELFAATGSNSYLDAARIRADHLNRRLTPAGWFVSDGGTRPFYHGVDAGFPVLSLVYYLKIEPDAVRAARAKQTIRRSLRYQLRIDGQVANPYDYPRQTFQTYKNGKLSAGTQDGFFMPHDNETGYWWQGESARLASLATAAVQGGRLVSADRGGAFGVSHDLARFAQNQLDWTLGRNPYGMTMLYGFGARNPPSAESAGDMLVGGISNGITGATQSPDGAGIVFAPGPDENQWRWVEQWLPHSTWFLLAAVVMAQDGV